jgi:peptide/nickel transport system substrate-binding protein
MPQDTPGVERFGSTRKRMVNRRKLLAAAGTGAAGLIAGCFGGEGDNGGPDDLVSNEFVTTELAAQEDVQFNPFNITLTPEWGLTMPLFPQMILDSRTHGEYYPLGMRDWTIDGDRVTAEVQDALTWHNGDQVTADDVVRSMRLADLVNEPIDQYIDDSREDIYAEDDTTVVLELNNEYNPAPLLSDAFWEIPIFAHEAIYGDIEDRFLDADSEDDVDAVSAEYAEMNVRGDELEPYACGPFELDMVDTQGAHYVKYDDYPWTEIQQNLEENHGLDLSEYPDELNYEQRMSRFFGERPALHQAAIQGEIDGGDGFEIDSQDELENEYPPESELNPIVGGWTDAFVFNLRDGEHADMWRDVRVRQAFAHILNFEGINGQYHGDWGEVDREFNGMSPPMEEEGWVDDDWNDQLTTYEEDWDRAEELLLDAGLTEEDGQWYKPDGEPFEVVWSAPSTVQWQINGMEYAASNLSEFGIDSTVEVVEGTTYFGQTIPNLDYEVARGFIGFANIVSGWELTWIRDDAEEQDEDPFANYLTEPYGEPGVEVPPIGEPDSSDTLEVNPVELQEELLYTTDEERIQEITETLSWTFNQTVPKLPGGAGVYNWYMTKRWNYPDNFGEDPLAGLMPYTYSLPQIGAISAKTNEEYEY